uniref:2-carboxy-1,4-naphthoquinone phytyltransferase, chloroplastic isoform X4 n=1 Tax=Erigeron canadensis TaxID=72917 RepID=UPI001CB93ABD|nr:2-carboxy-1,4-naphthoquinone phytyltransferase, chloroplastic isoform X4 [Erigeron canadensis]
MSKFCNQSSWMFGFHLQNTNNVTRYHPLVSLSGILKSSSVCCFATRLNFNETHVRRLEVHRQRRCQLVPTKSQTNDHITSSTHEDINEDGISKATLVWRAIKLPIYSVALVPLTVGSAAAYLQTGVYSAKQYALLLASSILIITWLNLSNDVYDFDTGADINKKESVVNMIGSRSGTLMAALLLLALGSTGLVWAAMEAANMRSMLLLASAITCGYIYQITGDKAVGKLSPLVRIGAKTGSNVVKTAVISLYALLFLLGICRALPVTSIFLCALTLPMGRLVVSFVSDNHQDNMKIFMAKYFCVRLHALFGAALAAGMVVARIITRISLPQSLIN